MFRLVLMMSPIETSSYSHTFALACQIDALSDRLLDYKEKDQLQLFADCLLESSLLSPEHYIEALTGADTAEDLRQTIAKATTWADLKRPVAVFATNILMQLLVTMDLEFCAKYLEGFEATPVFKFLLPCLAGHAQPVAGSNVPISRDWAHLPVRRLIDLSACLRHLNKYGKWPEQIPAVGQIERWTNGNAAQITKWRTGRRFASRNFQALWDGMFEYLPVAARPGMPLPLLFAATVFSRLFVKGSQKRKKFSIIIVDPDEYYRCWNIQRERLALLDKGLSFGNKPWMPGLR